MSTDQIDTTQDLEAALAADLGIELGAETAVENEPQAIPAGEASTEPAAGSQPESQPTTDSPRAPWLTDDDAETAEAEDDAEPVEQPSTQLLASIKEQFGVDLSAKYRDDNEALKGLVNSLQLVGRRDEHAQLGRLLVESPEQVFAHLAQRFGHLQQGQQQGQPPGPQPPPQVVNPADLFAKTYRDPETGSLRETEPGVLKKIHEYTQEFLKDPAKFLNVDERAQQIADQRLAQFQQQWAQQQQALQARAVADHQAVSFLQSNPWLFVDGKQEKGLSQAGHAFNQMYQQVVAEVPGVPQHVQTELAILRLKEQHKAKTAAKPAPRAGSRAAVSKPGLRPARQEGPDAPWPDDLTLEQRLMQLQEAGQIDLG